MKMSGYTMNKKGKKASGVMYQKGMHTGTPHVAKGLKKAAHDHYGKAGHVQHQAPMPKGRSPSWHGKAYPERKGPARTKNAHPKSR
jgi:hypothetical protein